ncbi:MAG: hypothetical protein AB7G28_19925 [Pirellulales bacterium]
MQIQLAPRISPTYDINMTPIEFQTELHGESSLPLPPEVVAQLPKSGRAKVVLLLQDDPADADWRRGAYEQFMKDDDPEDAVYDSYS